MKRAPTGNVRVTSPVVAAELAARVEQQEVAVGELAVVLRVVEHGGVGAACSDGAVARSAAAAVAEQVLDQRLDLILGVAGT